MQIEQTAIGLNYMDVYQRSGAYPLDLPSPLGLEAAGTVAALGEGVERLAEGDRVAYAGVLGAYAEPPQRACRAAWSRSPTASSSTTPPP